MTTNCGDDPLFLKQIISRFAFINIFLSFWLPYSISLYRYETEEDDFLREIDSMQQCANTDTSDDFVEESPVLGMYKIKGHYFKVFTQVNYVR